VEGRFSISKVRVFPMSQLSIHSSVLFTRRRFLNGTAPSGLKPREGNVVRLVPWDNGTMGTSVLLVDAAPLSAGLLCEIPRTHRPMATEAEVSFRDVPSPKGELHFLLVRLGGAIQPVI
jgi:hypothetical protein